MGKMADVPGGSPCGTTTIMKNRPVDWKEGDAFQDISSYSSPEKRRADQKAMEDQRRSAQRTSGRNAGKSGKNSQDIYSSSRPVRRKKGSIGKKIVAVLLALVVVFGWKPRLYAQRPDDDLDL